MQCQDEAEAVNETHQCDYFKLVEFQGVAQKIYCPLGYWLFDDRNSTFNDSVTGCVPCQNGCGICTIDGLFCLACNPPYFLTNNTIARERRCVRNCSEYNSSYLNNEYTRECTLNSTGPFLNTYLNAATKTLEIVHVTCLGKTSQDNLNNQICCTSDEYYYDSELQACKKCYERSSKCAKCQFFADNCLSPLDAALWLVDAATNYTSCVKPENYELKSFSCQGENLTQAQMFNFTNC